MAVARILASTVTVDEARLAVARNNGCPSWPVLMERAAATAATRAEGWTVTPLQHAGKAIRHSISRRCKLSCRSIRNCCTRRRTSSHATSR